MNNISDLLQHALKSWVTKHLREINREGERFLMVVLGTLDDIFYMLVNN